MRRLLCALVFVSACTKPNPAKQCVEGTCTTPNYPFCDVTGFVSGEPGTCIAVTCEAGVFGECRDDLEVRCNTTGTNYDVVMCQRGCDAASDGCRLCDPGETACTNGTLATCDASGAVSSSSTCPLGCFEDEPRCRDIDPSNNLGVYLDMTPNPPDLDLSNAVFNVDTGVVTQGLQSVAVPSHIVYPTGNGVAIRVFVARTVKLNSASIAVDGDARDAPHAAFALVASGEITITGEILIPARAGGGVAGCAPGLNHTFANTDGSITASGGGGGGNATAGGQGGRGGSTTGGIGDAVSGTPAIVPLRGGCSGGFSEAPVPGLYPNGGAAIQLSSARKITIDATIDARGLAGIVEQFDQSNGFLVRGGGAGGSILLEAPDIVLGANAKLLATGGKGGQACTSASTSCAAGGAGATVATAAGRGGDVDTTSAVNSAGGGGGGLGRIRINTRDTTYMKATTSVEAGSLTTGPIRTR